MSRIGPLRGRSISSRRNALVVVVAVGEPLVLVAGQLAVGEAEAAAAGQALGIGGAGLVERPAHRRPPVDDDGVARVVADMAAADVERLGRDVGGQGVGATEERRDAGVGGQGAEPFGAGGAEPLGGPGVHPGVGDGRGGGPHLGQAVGRPRQVGALGGEDGIGDGGLWRSGVRHGRRTLRRPAPAVTPLSVPRAGSGEVGGGEAAPGDRRLGWSVRAEPVRRRNRGPSRSRPRAAPVPSARTAHHHPTQLHRNQSPGSCRDPTREESRHARRSHRRGGAHARRQAQRRPVRHPPDRPVGPRPPVPGRPAPGSTPSHVDDVIWGCVSQVGEQTYDIARNAVLGAGWPETRAGHDRRPPVRLLPAGRALRRGRPRGRALRRRRRRRRGVDEPGADGLLAGRPEPARRAVPGALRDVPEPGHRRGDDRRAVGPVAHPAGRVRAPVARARRGRPGRRPVRRPDRRRSPRRTARSSSSTRASAGAAPSRDWPASRRRSSPTASSAPATPARSPTARPRC